MKNILDILKLTLEKGCDWFYWTYFCQLICCQCFKVVQAGNKFSIQFHIQNEYEIIFFNGWVNSEVAIPQDFDQLL